MSKQRLRPNSCNGVRRIEQTAPPPARRVVQDDEFIRDIFALAGRAADVGQQFRPISIDHVMDGVTVNFRAGVHVMLAMSGNMLIGAIDGGPIHDTRAKHGPAWQAVNNLLDRQGIDPAISDRQPVEVA